MIIMSSAWESLLRHHQQNEPDMEVVAEAANGGVQAIELFVNISRT